MCTLCDIIKCVLIDHSLNNLCSPSHARNVIILKSGQLKDVSMYWAKI